MPSKGGARKRPTCRTKAAYRSQEQAKRALTLIRGADDRGRGKPNRAYRCDLCGKWHLTSQNPR